MKEKIQFWKVKTAPLSGSNYNEMKEEVVRIFEKTQINTKRRVYVRSAYFKKRKILFFYFWKHLLDKPIAQRKARLRFVPCALDLLKHSTAKPELKVVKSEQMYRFYGKTQKDELFVIQIKETSRKRLQCMSIYPKK